MTSDDLLSSIVGRFVTGLLVSNDRQWEMVIVTDGGRLRLPTYGDCCSESWWADAVGVRQLLGHRVESAEWIPMPTPHDGRTRQLDDATYGLRITTDAGVCDLIYRNSSNGYYGGWCSPEWDAAAAVAFTADDFTPIERDWRA